MRIIMRLKGWLKRFIPLPAKWAYRQYQQLYLKLKSIERKFDVNNEEIKRKLNANNKEIERKFNTSSEVAVSTKNLIVDIEATINDLVSDFTTFKQSFDAAFSNRQRLKSEALTLFLTTFPQHRSANVGDNLICDSAMQLLYSKKAEVNPVICFRENSLDAYPDGSIKCIIAPGFSVSNDVYPNLYKLYKDINRLPIFFPIGCSFQHITPSYEVFENYVYNQDTLNFLKSIVEKNGPLPCRDRLITNMLINNGVSAIYSMDMAIFDQRKIGANFCPPTRISSIVVTIQHNSRYNNQSIALLRLIKEVFTDTKLYIAFHSRPNSNSQKIASFATSIGFIVLNLFSNVDNLKLYDSIDLHIGYRLHGHIYFLRNRKPSVLLIEDARSFGFAKTRETSVGCFDSLLPGEGDIVDELAPTKVIEFVNKQINSDFYDYNEVFSSIDMMYNDFIDPFFNKIARIIS